MGEPSHAPTTPRVPRRLTRRAVGHGNVVEHAVEIAVHLCVGAERCPRQREGPTVVRPEDGQENDEHGDKEKSIHG
ncbi:hypothetical protein [Terrabacter sp. BE26]|uniref:hypothetical protein n=1 Tax=Terrabacter sp. BE26 TaxID=2898152 RepID=UPI0035BE32E4